MNYLTCHQWAEKWNVSPRIAAQRIRINLKHGRMVHHRCSCAGVRWDGFRYAVMGV